MTNKSLKKEHETLIVLAILLCLGIFYRFIHYLPNFTPIAAISLFSGFYFRKQWALLLPVLTLLLSDIFIGFYEWQIMASVYASFILIGLIGMLMNKKIGVSKIILGSLTGSFLFFVITNFATWYFSNWYSHSMHGLAQCYFMAIPFFRNTLIGDLFYNGALFGCYGFYRFYVAKDLGKMRKTSQV
jgi:hypothetical protein